jgi:hypothetical protein
MSVQSAGALQAPPMKQPELKLSLWYKWISPHLYMSNDQIPLRRHIRQHLEVYDVTSDQLQRMEAAGNELGLDLQLSLALLSSASSFLVGLLLSPPPEGTIKTVLLSITVVGFVGGIIFGIRYFWFRSTHSDVFAEVRGLPVGPLGDEGHRLRSADLAQLPLEAAPVPPPAPPAPPAQPEAPPAAAAAATPEPEHGE